MMPTGKLIHATLHIDRLQVSFLQVLSIRNYGHGTNEQFLLEPFNSFKFATRLQE